MIELGNEEGIRYYDYSTYPCVQKRHCCRTAAAAYHVPVGMVPQLAVSAQALSPPLRPTVEPEPRRRGPAAVDLGRARAQSAVEVRELGVSSGTVRMLARGSCRSYY